MINLSLLTRDVIDEEISSRGNNREEWSSITESSVCEINEDIMTKEVRYYRWLGDDSGGMS